MRLLRIIATTNLAIIFVRASAAAGQVIPSAYDFIESRQSFGMFVGSTNLDSGQLGLDPSSASTAGARWALDVGGTLSLEVNGTMFEAERDVLAPSRPENDQVLGQSDMTIVQFDVRLRLNLTGHRTWHGIQPFVSFGGGIAGEAAVDRTLEDEAVMPQDQRFDFGNRLTATLGTGVNFRLAERLYLRVDGLLTLGKMGTPTGWVTVEVDPDRNNPDGEWLAGQNLLIGATWRW